MLWKRSAPVLAALLFVSAPAMAAPVNLVVNGSFEDATATDKGGFSDAGVAGWNGGQGLTFLDFPGTADDPAKYLAVYGPFPSTSPDGGKFVEADGDPTYSVAVSQTISGLTIGQQYVLNFYQAAGQQLGYTGPTTERWAVTFGDDTQLSSRFSLPEGGVGPWQAQSMTFTATATSQLLSFLAQGTPNGQPPISFLDGVTLFAAVPEPASWAMTIVGFGAIGGMVRRRRVAMAAA